MQTITITAAEDARQQRLFEQYIAEHTVRKPVVAQRPRYVHTFTTASVDNFTLGSRPRAGRYLTSRKAVRVLVDVDPPIHVSEFLDIRFSIRDSQPTVFLLSDDGFRQVNHKPDGRYALCECEGENANALGIEIDRPAQPVTSIELVFVPFERLPPVTVERLKNFKAIQCTGTVGIWDEPIGGKEPKP